MPDTWPTFGTLRKLALRNHLVFGVQGETFFIEVPADRSGTEAFNIAHSMGNLGCQSITVQRRQDGSATVATIWWSR